MDRWIDGWMDRWIDRWMEGREGDTPVLSSTPCAMVHGKNKGMVMVRQHDEHRHGYHYNVC